MNSNDDEEIQIGDLITTANGDQYIVTQPVVKGQVASQKITDDEKFIDINDITSINGKKRTS